MQVSERVCYAFNSMDNNKTEGVDNQMKRKGNPKAIELVTIGKYTVSIGDAYNYTLHGGVHCQYFGTLENALHALCNKVAKDKATDLKSYIAELQQCVADIRTAIGSDTAARTINQAIRKMTETGD